MFTSSRHRGPRLSRRRVAALIALLAVSASLLPWSPVAQAESTVRPDAANDVGRHSALALDRAGNPVVAYWDDSRNELKVLHCTDPNCKEPGGLRVPDRTTRGIRSLSMQLDAAGNPVLVYTDSARQLIVLHCDDPFCAGTETPTRPVPTGILASWVSFVLDEAGNPAIAFIDYSLRTDRFGQPAGELSVLRCDDPDCEGEEEVSLPDPDSESDLRVAMSLDQAGNPVLVYVDDYSPGLRFLHCDDAHCSGPESPRLVDTGPHDRPYGLSIEIDPSDRPLISYWNTSFEEYGLKVLHCDDPDCLGAETPSRPDRFVHQGDSVRSSRTNLTLDANGNPAVLYTDPEERLLRLLRCDNRGCSSGAPSAVVAAAPFSPPDTSLVLDSADHPVIAYYDAAEQDLVVLHCDDPACLPTAACEGATITIEARPGVTTVGTDGDDVILGTDGPDIIEAGAGNDIVCGLGGDDLIQGGQGDDYIEGGPGADRLFGAQGHDHIVGGEDDDVIHGNSGDDELVGEDGDDKIFGYADNDRIYGGLGDDRLHGNFGNDRMFGGDGDDRMFGYGDNDYLSLGPGDDLAGGNFGDDEIHGDDGNDRIYGSDGADIISGGNGNDALDGNSGPDVLNGGEGNDRIDGGIFPDVCNGDGGVDTATRCETISGVP